MSSDELLDAALHLPQGERAKLARELLRSLDEDPEDPGTAWFVPAVKDEHRIPASGELVVSRTRDGGKTFEVLRNGLPQQDAYDLVYRHCLDIDETGSRLAFGSTTGGLWVTEDQGDNWTCVSHHLPPIYAVRFVPA